MTWMLFEGIAIFPGHEALQRFNIARVGPFA